MGTSIKLNEFSMGFTETHQCYGETVTVNAKAKILMHRERKTVRKKCWVFWCLPKCFY